MFAERRLSHLTQCGVMKHRACSLCKNSIRYQRIIDVVGLVSNLLSTASFPIFVSGGVSACCVDLWAWRLHQVHFAIAILVYVYILWCAAGRDANVEIANLLAETPDHSGAQIRQLIEERRRLTKQRKIIAKAMKNETRKRKRLLAKLTKFSVPELVGFAAMKSIKERRQSIGH